MYILQEEPLFVRSVFASFLLCYCDFGVRAACGSSQHRHINAVQDPLVFIIGTLPLDGRLLQAVMHACLAFICVRIIFPRPYQFSQQCIDSNNHLRIVFQIIMKLRLGTSRGAKRIRKIKEICLQVGVFIKFSFY